MYVHAIGARQLKNLISHHHENALSERVHGNAWKRPQTEQMVKKYRDGNRQRSLQVDWMQSSSGTCTMKLDLFAQIT